MFDIGFWEILIIGIVTLLVVGPQRLPGVAVFAGHWIGRIRRFVRNMRDEINEELETEHLKSLVAEQNREISELRKDVEAVRGETERSFRDAEEQVREADPNTANGDVEAADTPGDQGARGESGTHGGAGGAAADAVDPDESASAKEGAESNEPRDADSREKGTQ